MAKSKTSGMSISSDGRARVVIENMRPEVDGGRFPAKRTVGDSITVEADVYVDGHDRIACLALHRREGDEAWYEVPMTPAGNATCRSPRAGIAPIMSAPSLESIATRPSSAPCRGGTPDWSLNRSHSHWVRRPGATPGSRRQRVPKRASIKSYSQAVAY